MATIALIIVIYIAFISLGLPDSMLGAAWPAMFPELGVPVSFAGFISMTVCLGTVTSSINYARLARHLSTGVITAVSVSMTAVALIGFSFAPSFPVMIALALLLGLGAGAVDAGLNAYVALHFKARAMGFLHAFWGIGTMIGPFLLSYLFSHGLSWRRGYLSLGTAQLAVSLLLVVSLPLWKLSKGTNEVSVDEKNVMPTGEAMRKKGAIAALLGFFSYCAVENTAMLWSATFLVSARGFSESLAAQSAGVLFWGITIGRILCGLFSDRTGDERMILMSHVMMAIAIIMLFTVPEDMSAIALFMLGVGFGPIFPSMIHQTPAYFGAEASPAILGMEMTAAYVGSMFMPPFFGWLGRTTTFAIFPLYALFFLVFNIVVLEVKKRRRYGN